jgi:hypothetical protein
MNRLSPFLTETVYDKTGSDRHDDDCFLVETVQYVERKEYAVWVETVGSKVIVGRSCCGKKGGNTKRRDDVTEKERLRRDRENLKRSCGRAYKRVIDCIGGAKCDRMLTLTFQENIVDIDIALIAFKKFIALAYARFGRFDYVAVPERQKRGAIHYHLAVNRYLFWEDVLKIWREAVSLVSKLTGGIDIRKKKVDQKQGESKVAALGRYIAKYVSKAFYCQEFDANSVGRKRYYSNMKIHRETVKITSRHDDVLICSLDYDGKESDYSAILSLICNLTALFVKKYSFVSKYIGFSYRYETVV